MNRAPAQTLRMAIGGLMGAIPIASAHAQNQVWLRQFGTFSYDAASAVVADREGNIFVAGETGGSLFGPLLSHPDVFLATFDDSGNPRGGVQFGTTFFDRIHALAPAPGGGVFVAGMTNGSMGGPHAGDYDAWLARYDEQGGRVWITQPGSPAREEAETLAPDGAGGVFVAGYTLGVLVNPPPAGPAYGWIARYDGAGRRMWLRQYVSGAKNGGGILGAAPDGTGGLFVASGAASDVWIGRFDADGDVIWGRQFGSPADDFAITVSPDGAGGLFAAGLTLGSLAAPNGGEWDVWVARYDGAGNQLAIAQFGTSASDFVESMAPDGLGGAFIAGSTNGPLGGPHGGLADAWIAHTQSGIGRTWIRQLATPYFDAALSVASAGRGGAFVAGITDGNLKGPGGGPHNGDVWVARYETCYSDCNSDGALTVADFGCFQTRFITADMYADCNADGVLTVPDFGCFQTEFVVGCP